MVEISKEALSSVVLLIDQRNRWISELRNIKQSRNGEGVVGLHSVRDAKTSSRYIERTTSELGRGGSPHINTAGPQDIPK